MKKKKEGRHARQIEIEGEGNKSRGTSKAIDRTLRRDAKQVEGRRLRDGGEQREKEGSGHGEAAAAAAIAIVSLAQGGKV